MNQPEVWGSVWAREFVEIASESWETNPATANLTTIPTFMVNGLSLQAGGDSHFHSTHENGMNVDLEAPFRESIADYATTGSGMYRSLPIAAGGRTVYYIAAGNSPTHVIFEVEATPGVRTYQALNPANFTLVIGADDKDASVDIANSPNAKTGNVPWASASPVSWYDYETILGKRPADARSFDANGWLVDNPNTVGGQRYSLAEMKAFIENIPAYRSGGPWDIDGSWTVKTMYFNDVRLMDDVNGTWRLADGTQPENFVEYSSGHWGHVHVVLGPPEAPATPAGGNVSPALASVDNVNVD